MKTLWMILGSLLLLLVIGLLVAGFFLGSIVREGVNRVGPQVTKSEVVLQGAKLSPFTGAGSLQGLRVGNPQGWSNNNALSVETLQFRVAPTTLMKDTIVVEELVVQRPEFVYEHRLPNGSNLKDLIENIRTAVGTPSEKPIGAPEEPEKKFIIHKLRVQDGRIRVGVSGIGTEVPLPALSYDELGVQEGGLTGAQIAQVVLRDVMGRALSAVTGQGGGISLPGETGQTLKAVGDLIKDPGAGLNKLLGGDKDQAPAPDAGKTEKK